ncbi:MAG: hypothetical protein V8K32_06080 [Candidatus Electrothrix gigas]
MKKRVIKINMIQLFYFILALSFFVTASSSFANAAQCYWMENTEGSSWVDAPQGNNISKLECYELDSCDGGKGKSGGGCYKWATSADGERMPWFSCFWMKNTEGNPWVYAPQGDISKQQCYELDSCDGGKGHSGGGCYKWALTADSPRIPWD